MPDFGRVSQIDGSSFDNGTAYVAVKKMLLGDRAPYIFRTRDYGKSWTKIVNGIAANDYVHTVREDPVRRGLLYAGTQHGAYISFDDGERVAAVQERPARYAGGGPRGREERAGHRHARPQLLRDGRHRRAAPAGHRRHGDVVLFKPADVIRGLERAGISYYLKAQPKSLTIEFLDAKGQVMRSINGQPPREAGRDSLAGGGGGGGGGFGRGRRARRWRRASIATRGISTRRRSCRFPG